MRVVSLSIRVVKSTEFKFITYNSRFQYRVKELGLDVALKGNPGMRKAIWAASADLQLTEMLLPVSKAKEDTKRIWEQIERWLPMFALFQSDRSSRDSDDEVQSPMKAAITAALAKV